MSPITQYPAIVVFIDEVHRLSPVVEETLYSAMEDQKIDIMNIYFVLKIIYEKLY